MKITKRIHAQVFAESVTSNTEHRSLLEDAFVAGWAACLDEVKELIELHDQSPDLSEFKYRDAYRLLKQRFEELY